MNSAPFGNFGWEGLVRRNRPRLRVIRSDSPPAERGIVRIQSATDHELTVIVPAFNEEGRLPQSLRELRRFLNNWQVDYRILVVDDGSSDRTSRCAEGMGPRVSTIGLSRQSGKGAAVRAGMLAATGDVLAFTDADVPYDLESLRRGYERISEDHCQVVFGARDMRGAGCRAQRRVLRTVASFLFRQCMRALVSRRFTDTQCGLKLFSRPAAVEIFSRTTVDGFAFDAEVVFLAARLGLRCERIPVTLVNEYASTLSLARHALPMLLDVFRVRQLDLRGGYAYDLKYAEPMHAKRERGARRRAA